MHIVGKPEVSYSQFFCKISDLLSVSVIAYVNMYFAFVRIGKIGTGIDRGVQQFLRLIMRGNKNIYIRKLFPRYIRKFQLSSFKAHLARHQLKYSKRCHSLCYNQKNSKKEL